MATENGPDTLKDPPPHVPPPAARDWRQDLVGVGGIAAILGVWLVVSPFALDYKSDDATWNPIICGAIVTLAASAQTIGGVRSSTSGWILMAVGVWLFCSGFWLADSSQASWNAWSAGALAFFLGSVSAAATVQRRAG